MKPETKLQYFDIYAHNKNILDFEYVQIAGSTTKSRILYIKCRSNVYKFNHLSIFLHSRYDKKTSFTREKFRNLTKKNQFPKLENS